MINRMNKVELVFNKAETRLAGFPYGRDVYMKQVNGKVDLSGQIEIVFPKQIEKVASSFVQGFFSELVSKIGYIGIDQKVTIVSSSSRLSYTIRKNIY